VHQSARTKAHILRGDPSLFDDLVRRTSWTYGGSRLGPLQLKIPYTDCPGLCAMISVQVTLEMCVAAQNCQKIHKNHIVLFKGIQGIAIGVNQKPRYDFVLLINSNLGPISHHFWDTTTNWLKLTNFPYPLSFSTLAWDDPFWIYGTALRFLILESSRQLTVMIWWSYLAPFLTDPPV